MCQEELKSKYGQEVSIEPEVIDSQLKKSYQPVGTTELLIMMVKENKIKARVKSKKIHVEISNIRTNCW